ncbi:MAG: (2Fe-2S)-binding protein [Chloroflexi bacterium]|nr:(2Fe-2S)-binding protein [Chloroflexota bacterium]
MNHNITLTVNGVDQHLTVASHQTLVRVLREQLGLTGGKAGCLSGQCGTCSVLLNNDIVNACMVLAAEIDGCEIQTIEGLAQGDRLHPLQQAFLDHGGMQCGFCTSGMVMSAYALLQRSSRPDENEIRSALVGNLCRCTGYADIIKSVQVASRSRR